MYLLIPKLPIPPPPPPSIPRHLTGVFLLTVEIWKFVQWGIGLSGENSGQHHKQKDFVILSTLCIICTMIMGHYSYIHCFVGALESLWKSQ